MGYAERANPNSRRNRDYNKPATTPVVQEQEPTLTVPLMAKFIKFFKGKK